MALEAGTYISDLVAANPDGASPKSSMDDHLRLIKGTIKATFPNLTGPMNASPAELNYSVGVTSAIQVQFAAQTALSGTKGAITGQAWTGTHNFAGAVAVTVPTLAYGSAGAYAASIDYVNAAAFSAVLPGQAGNAGKFLTTNGAVASWALPFPAQAGNSGKVLSTDGTNASWSGQAMDLLATITPTAVAAIDALTVFTSAYDCYRIEGEGVTTGGGTVNLLMRFANVGVVDTGSNYYSVVTGAAASTTAATSMDTGLSCTGTSGISFSMMVYNANSASADKHVRSETNGRPASAGIAAASVAHAYTAANAISGIRFLFAGGTFGASGKIRIYGIKN